MVYEISKSVNYELEKYNINTITPNTGACVLGMFLYFRKKENSVKILNGI